LNIRIFYEDIGFRLKSWKRTRAIVSKVISKENKFSGDLNFILTNDATLIEINKKFLGRDYFTDVIAFDYCMNNEISGDVYISLETVKLNAKNYKVSYNEEIFRVMIHGLLHLCGYNDSTEDEKKRMRIKEDQCITEWKNQRNGL